MKIIKPLDSKFLRKKSKSSQFNFTNSDTVKSLTEFVGQERAIAAFNFGIDIKNTGYNIYAMGPSGIGKRTIIRAVLKEHAKRQPIPPDWCYIHNFESPGKPIAFKLPAGKGILLQQDMKSLLSEVSTNILAVFESDHYNAEIKKIYHSYKSKQSQLRKKNTKLKSNLPVPSLYKEQRTEENNLKRKLLTAALEPSINHLKTKYADFPICVNFLNAAQKDILDHIEDFVKHDDQTNLFSFSLENPILTKYKINLLVDNSKLKHAPIIFEHTPCYSNLICRVEHTSEMGNLITNFTLIRPGTLHLANGGYLIIEARKLKKDKETWEALKSALYSKEIKIEPIQNIMNSVAPVSLEPTSIPLDLKVILIGSRNIYYSFCQNDQDFLELFKVPVDFDEQIERNNKNILLYARLIATIARREKLLPFHVTAITEIIDFCSRVAEDIKKLSTHIGEIEDLILESHYWASKENKSMVKAADVEKALTSRYKRMDRAREIYYEDILRDFIIIKTTGTSVGQVNCLSVRRVGNFSYGHPTRVTATIKMGRRNKLIDIQREIKMAGPMHAKAGLIISNFLDSRFNLSQLYSISASIAFEQIYAWTDGDSASVGELCALLSALSNIPLYQSFAITGSIDQYGEVQSIGGINEKIEGFFDICKARGLDGKQGVLMPSVNGDNLMLREDIVAAAKAKKFFIYPINTIDEAITLLTGMPAGVRNRQGFYPKGTFYHQIEVSLQKFSKNPKSK